MHPNLQRYILKLIRESYPKSVELDRDHIFLLIGLDPNSKAGLRVSKEVIRPATKGSRRYRFTPEQAADIVTRAVKLLEEEAK